MKRNSFVSKEKIKMVNIAEKNARQFTGKAAELSLNLSAPFSF